MLCAGWLAAGAALAQPAPSEVTCTVPDDLLQREYRLHRDAGTWRLAFRSRDTRDVWIALELPRAQPVLTATEVTLSYRNANGGRQVRLEVTPGRRVLDVWVDHGLEVNIEPDLDPRIDLMSTDGPIDDVRCVIE